MTFETAISTALQEKRVFPPSDEFRARAHIKSLEEYELIYRRAEEHPEEFWAGIASELHWFKPWDKVLEWELPFSQWFVGGELNISYNCLDRHAASQRKDKPAILWEGEPGDSRTLTYQQLLEEVSKFANVLKSLGVSKGDRVAIYMGMVPELAIALLACARLGAPHTVIFGGFSSQSLIDRINDCGAIAVVTQDAGYRRGAEVKLRRRISTCSCRARLCLRCQMRTSGAPLATRRAAAPIVVPGHQKGSSLYPYPESAGAPPPLDCPPCPP